ncbi:MAG TPA: pyridoxamine 5'-phosphate oxidase family protein, partial [Candidatus Limnocylindrales bacterium]|nr:pyridoxamine 5'-phosphate oxidase family protein [Candidatus Limnocylindrales bacterium]
TAIWRTGDRLYWHGSAASRMVRATKHGAPVCITATILDGLVLARSGTNHSMNYRSVMILGDAHAVEGIAETAAALDAFVERLYPGRAAALRPATVKELRATTVLWLDLTEASAKIRADGVRDEPDDEAWPVWAGVVPVGLVAGEPEADRHVPAGMARPAYLPSAGEQLQRPTGLSRAAAPEAGLRDEPSPTRSARRRRPRS